MRTLLLLTIWTVIGAASVFAETPQPAPDEIFQHLLTRKERDLGSMHERMQKLHVPAVSVALIKDYQIAWTWTAGVRSAESGLPVDENTLFQAASISKPVSISAVHLLAAQQKMDLDAPINTQLKSWQVPPYDFPGAPAVTARLLMAHRAGTAVSGFPGYDHGGALPTLVEILSGTGSANTPAVVVALEPGRQFSYSGGGVTILELAVQDLTGKPATDVVRELVMEPIGMSRSFFSQPLAADLSDNFAAGHLAKGEAIPGCSIVHPEHFAAGLWSTPTDLCRFAIAIQNALRGEGDTPFTKEIAEAMTTPVADGPMGQGFVVEGNYFGHDGGNKGMRCSLRAHKTGGYGFAIMTNSDSGQSLQDLVFYTLQKAYGWEDSTQLP